MLMREHGRLACWKMARCLPKPCGQALAHTAPHAAMLSCCCVRQRCRGYAMIQTRLIAPMHSAPASFSKYARTRWSQPRYQKQSMLLLALNRTSRHVSNTVCAGQPQQCRQHHHQQCGGPLPSRASKVWQPWAAAEQLAADASHRC